MSCRAPLGLGEGGEAGPSDAPQMRCLPSTDLDNNHTLPPFSLLFLPSFPHSPPDSSGPAQGALNVEPCPSNPPPASNAKGPSVQRGAAVPATPLPYLTYSPPPNQHRHPPHHGQSLCLVSFSYPCACAAVDAHYKRLPLEPLEDRPPVPKAGRLPRQRLRPSLLYLFLRFGRVCPSSRRQQQQQW